MNLTSWNLTPSSKPFSFTAQQIAEVVNGEVVGNATCIITGVADLDSASLTDASFYSNARYASKLKSSKAGLILATKEDVVEGKNFLVVSNPSAAFQKVIELFAKHMPQDHGFEGIHPQASVDPTAKIGKNVTLGAFTFIGSDVVIGDNTVIYPGCIINRGVLIGSQCLLYANVSIRQDCVIKDRVIIQPGAVIGSCGFGYVTDKVGKHTKLNQLGNVLIEDDVEIGASTTIDRARFQSTVIGQGTKIDNLVQIGHGVVIGKHCIIVAQTGIAGSTTIGNHVVIGGQVGISGHIEIADFVSIGAKSGVSKSLLKSGKYAGVPAIPFGEYQRMQVALKRSVSQRAIPQQEL